MLVPIAMDKQHVPTNGFSCEVMRVMKREVVEPLEDLCIMSAREVVEYDQSDDDDMKIGDYLSKYYIS